MTQLHHHQLQHFNQFYYVLHDPMIKCSHLVEKNDKKESGHKSLKAIQMKIYR